MSITKSFDLGEREILSVWRRVMQERNYNLDLIRSVEVIFVLSVHFFLNSGFYGIICEGEKNVRNVCFANKFYHMCSIIFNVNWLSNV